MIDAPGVPPVAIHPRPPRAWRQHWHDYLAHALTGILFGWLCPPAQHAAWGIVIYLAYQVTEWLRMRDGRGDTVSRDIGDLGYGYVAGHLLRRGWEQWRLGR